MRIEARRLRRDLDRYHVDAGRDAPVRISVPTGGYVPHFERQRDAAIATPAQPLEDIPVSAGREKRQSITLVAPKRQHWLRTAGLAAAAVAAAAATAFWTWHRIDTMSLLPFEPAGTGDRTRFPAAGFTQQLVTDLMRLGGLRLYAGTPADTRDSAAPDRHGVRYVSYRLVGPRHSSGRDRQRVGRSRLAQANGSLAPRLAVDTAALYRGHRLTDDTVRLLVGRLTAAGWRVPKTHLPRMVGGACASAGSAGRLPSDDRSLTLCAAAAGQVLEVAHEVKFSSHRRNFAQAADGIKPPQE